MATMPPVTGAELGDVTMRDSLRAGLKASGIPWLFIFPSFVGHDDHHFLPASLSGRYFFFLIFALKT